MAREWPDYETEMKKKAKAKRRGSDFIVSDSDDEDMKNHQSRAKKRKQNGIDNYDHLTFGRSFILSAGLLFQIDVNLGLSCYRVA